MLYKNGGANLGEVDRIKELARERDVTMNSLCRAIGRSTSYFSDKRRTGSAIPDDTLEIIAKRLSTTAAYLRGDTSDPSLPEPAYGYQEQDLAELMDVGLRLNSAGRRELINYGGYLSGLEEYQRPTGDVRSIRHYIVPAAAGYASPVEGEDFEILELSGVPAGADFCVTVSGDSMEPYIRDGDMAFVRRNTDLEDLDVGVFFLDGDVLIKQVVTDPFKNVYLLSANPHRQDANRIIPHDSASTLVCFGKVICQKLPRPEYV